MAKLRAVVRRRWPIVAVTLVLGVIAGVVSTTIGPDRQTTVFQADQVIVANRLTGNPADVPQDALKVTRGEVPEVAAEILEQPGRGAALARDVQVKEDVDSSSISLRVYDTDPEVASEVVQAFSTAFLQVVNAELRSEDTRQLEQLQERVDEATAALAAFDEANGFIANPNTPLPNTPTVEALVAERTRLRDALSQAQTRYDDAELEISQREPYSTLGPEKPRVADAQLLEVPASPLFRAGLLGLVGLLLGIGLVMVLERVNRRVDTREELGAVVSVPIIAEIGRIAARKQPQHADGRIKLEGVWAEHYRRVRSAIEFVQLEARATSTNGSTPASAADSTVIQPHQRNRGEVPKVFLFVSALPGEGKSTSTALTGLALAEAGTDTLVINADFRRPMVEKYLGVSSSPSLADRAELRPDRPSIDAVVQSGGQDHLWVAAAGPPTLEVGSRLTAAREMAIETAERGGTVLIDSSPLRVSNDPIDLLAVTDEVILVVRAGRTTVKSLRDTMDVLAMHQAPILGVVLVGTLGSREMYTYYQAYSSEADAARNAAPRPTPAPQPTPAQPASPPQAAPAPAPAPAHAAPAHVAPAAPTAPAAPAAPSPANVQQTPPPLPPINVSTPPPYQG